MFCEILINLKIWYHSTDVSDSEEYIEYSKICCIVYMPDFTSCNYVYFKDNEEEPKSIHKVLYLIRNNKFL